MGAACLALCVAACQKKPTPEDAAGPPDPATTATTAAAVATTAAAPVASFTVVRVCPGGAKIYGPEPYAFWENDMWVKIEGPLWRIC